MEGYKLNNITELICGNPYVGRGIVVGKSLDGKNAVSAYFIMGRSANSRNRIFTEKDGVLYTTPFDSTKVENPDLIIYAALRKWKNKLILANGDHTDTIYTSLQNGKSFRKAFESRTFEPDSPHFTPRISAVLTFLNSDFSYEMSILKSGDVSGTVCNRFMFSYTPLTGVGHFIHTYRTDGDPLPAFTGEPERVSIPADIDEFTSSLWNALDRENRISLYVRYTDLAAGKEENRLINANLQKG